MFRRAKEEGISEVAVRKIVVRLGGEGIAKDDLLPWLDNWIGAAQRELGRHTNEDKAFEAARKEAERRFKGGLDDPSSALMEEFAREEQAEAEHQIKRKRRRIRILEEAIKIDELALNAPGAVEKLRRIAEIEGKTGWREIGQFLVFQAGKFYERGDQKGENSALLVSLETYRSVLQELTRERDPLLWAGTQSNYAFALIKLGERESAIARLAEGVAAYRLAIDVWEREHRLADWALAQNNLGTALHRLGERESGTARFVEALAAFYAALQIWTRERSPLFWAMAQNNIGNALWRLGERESGTARLEEAVAAHRAALLERTRERSPLEWARTQNNLGLTLWTLGERESGTARLEEAVASLLRIAGGMDARQTSALLGNRSEQSRNCACRARGTGGWDRAA